jgi:hypothetical protein
MRNLSQYRGSPGRYLNSYLANKKQPTTRPLRSVCLVRTSQCCIDYFILGFTPPRDCFKDAAYHYPVLKFILTRALEGGPKMSYGGITDQPGLPFVQLTLCVRPSDNHTGYRG